MKTTKTAILTWAICLLFVAAGASAGGVLCIGGNGHAEVETACEPCCDEGSDECVVESPGSHHEEHEDCTDCADVPMNELTRSHAPSVRFEVDPDSLQYAFHNVPTMRMACGSFGPASLTRPHLSSERSFPSVLACTVLLI